MIAIEKPVTLVVVNNPFDTGDRTIREVDAGLGLALDVFLARYVEIPDDQEYHASINGRTYGPEEIPHQIVHPGDFVAVCPVLRGGGGGKNPLAILAGLALAFFSFGIVAPGASALFGGSVIAGKLAGGLAMMLGGQLISDAFAPRLDKDKDEQSYKWGALQPIQVQGAVVPITYGTIRTAGQILAQHISLDPMKGSDILYDTQYLHLLLCGGEGPVDEFSDIRVNDNPIENYREVTIEERKGTNDQASIKDFDEIYDDVYPQTQIESGTNDKGDIDDRVPGEWVTHDTAGTVAEFLEVHIDLPAGLYRVNDEGEKKGSWVWLEIQYKPVDSPTWIDWVSTGELKAKKTKAFSLKWRIAVSSAGRYSVRMRMKSKDDHTTSHINTTIWSRLSAIVQQPMVHPNKALLGIKIQATDQLSGGLPTVTWRQTRKTVLIHDKGNWVEKDAQNPAWIVYDLCVKARRLSGVVHVFGERPERMDLPMFAAWAAWNDREVSNRPALKMNLLVDESKSLWDWVNSIAASARGAVVLKGTRISCIWDQPSDPVQLFTMGNIQAGSFSGEFLPLESRANAVEISFLNEAKNFEREQITVYADGFDKMDGPANPVAVQLTGITDFDRAYREGLYRLLQNKYILRTISFGADVDAIACQVGDVILVQHDVPQWGQGGRILAVNGNRLKLDKTVMLQGGVSYALFVRTKNDTLVERMVSQASGETDEITVSGSTDALVPNDSVFALVEAGITPKPFRIQEMTRDGDLFVKLTCTEYIPEIYTEAGFIPDIDYTTGTNRIADLKLLPSGYYSSDGSWIAELWAHWSYRGQKPVAYEVQWKYDDDLWSGSVRTTEPTAQCPLRDTAALYSVRVRGLLAQAPPTDWAYATSEGIVLGNGIPPDPPTNLQAVGWMGFANLSWTNPRNIDLSYIEIWEAFEDDRSKAVQVGQTRADNYTRLLPAGGIAWYWVRAVNYTGQKSAFNSEAGTPCVIDPESFQAIIDEILKDPLLQEAIGQLQQPIEEIRDLADELAETVIKNSIRDYEDIYQQVLAERAAEKLAEAQIDGSMSEWEGWNHTLSAIVQERETREEQGEAYARMVDGVVAMIGDPENPGPDTVYAAVKDEKEARATLEEATGKRINDVLAVIGDPLKPTADSVYGAIRTEETARATRDEATAERLDTIASIVGDPSNPQPGTAFAAIQNEAKTRATADEAEAKRTDDLQAKLNTDIGAVKASIQAEQIARVNADSALSSNITTVQTQLNGNIASVQTIAEAVDGMKSRYSVVLNVNGYITGLVMNNGGQGKSNTVFHTDTFLVGKPGVNGGSPQYAFVIGTVNGRYQVAMNTAFIQDLSVDTLKIQGRAVTIPEGVSGISAVPWGNQSKDIIGEFKPLLYYNFSPARLNVANIIASAPIWLTLTCGVSGYAATIGFRVRAYVNDIFEGYLLETSNGWSALRDEIRSGTYSASTRFVPSRSGNARFEVDWKISYTHGGRDFNSSVVMDWSMLALQCKR